MATLPSGIGRSISTPPLSWNAKHSTKSAKRVADRCCRADIFSDPGQSLHQSPGTTQAEPQIRESGKPCRCFKQAPGCFEGNSIVRILEQRKFDASLVEHRLRRYARVRKNREQGDAMDPTRAKPEAPADERETVMAGIGDGFSSSRVALAASSHAVVPEM
jgi:hypothetical protein